MHKCEIELKKQSDFLNFSGGDDLPLNTIREQSEKFILSFSDEFDRKMTKFARQMWVMKNTNVFTWN